MSDDYIKILGEIRDELRALRIAAEGGSGATSAARSVRPADKKALEVILPGIAGSVGTDVVFTVADLFAHACTDLDLRGAFCRAFSADLGRRVTRLAGDLLKRTAGIDSCDGLYVERVGKVREGVLWILRRHCGNSHRVVAAMALASTSDAADK